MMMQHSWTQVAQPKTPVKDGNLDGALNETLGAFRTKALRCERYCCFHCLAFEIHGKINIGISQRNLTYSRNLITRARVFVALHWWRQV